MIFSYLKLALRNLYKYKLYAFINITGLSVAIACAIVAYMNYQFSQSYDTFHTRLDRIGMINSYKLLNDQRINWSIAPTPLGPSAKQEIPGIEEMARITLGSGTLRFGEKVFNEQFAYVDAAFMRIFSFAMVSGDAGALEEPDAILIDTETAERYFGEGDALGKQMTLSIDGEKTHDFIVRGIIEKAPKNATMRYAVFLPFDRLTDTRGFDLQDWESWSDATAVLLAENIAWSPVERKLQAYTRIANEANPDWLIAGYYLMPFRQAAMASRELRGDPYYGAMPLSAIIGPSITAVLILLLACFNYVNTAIASAAPRLKEIGIRKVVGGVRRQLVLQFLGENLVLCTIALILGLVLAELFVPAYDGLWPEISLTLSYFDNPDLLLFLAGLLFCTAIAAGAYPAFYISSFNPISIFRGKQRFGGTNTLIRVLLTAQLALSMTGIVMGLVFNKNADFIETADLGYNRDQVVVVPVKGEKQFTVFKNAIESRPDIAVVAGSRNQIGRSWHRVEIESGELRTEVTLFRVGQNYLDAMEIELAAGREPDPARQADVDGAILVNETLIREFGWSNPTDRFIKVKRGDNVTEYKVAGVVKDFKFNGVWRKVQPTLVSLAPKDQYRYMSIKFTGVEYKNLAQYLETTWKQTFPNLPYTGYFLDEMQAEATQVTQSIRTISLYVAIIAVLISGMGLFALVSLNIVRRNKEIGIRKILGASMTTVSRLISQEFVWLLLIASVLAAAFGYFSLRMLLGSIYAYHTDFGPVPFLASSLMVMVMAILTVGSQIARVAKANPVSSLRDE